jgi:pimeloyl-ACP methyl ester carboxylesterase
MPNTPNGTAYTLFNTNVGSYGECYYGVPNSLIAASNIPTVLYAHGANGSSSDLSTATRWALLRNWLADNGWAWIEGIGGGNSWGNDIAQAAYPAYLDYVETQLDIGIVVVMGRSMGGLISAWLYAMSPIKERFSGWINNSAVSTIFTGDHDPAAASIDKPSARWFTSMWDAYGVSSFDEMVLNADAIANAPENWLSSVWTDLNILSMYGDADTSVPWNTRGAGPLATIWEGLPTIDNIDIRVGGDHTSTNGSNLQIDAMATFLSTIIGETVSNPINSPLKISNGYFYYDGIPYPVTPSQIVSF